MRIVNTGEEDLDLLGKELKGWVYNGLDCCVTAEVMEAMLPQLDEHTSATYNFSRELQGPVLEMGARGVRVDPWRKREVINECFEKISTMEDNLETIVKEGLGLPSFSWKSRNDLQRVLHEALGIPKMLRGGSPTVNRRALERMMLYPVARPILGHIMAMRDMFEKVKKLRAETDEDGRMHTSLNIAGTSTGRFSSSESEFGTGTNLQNVEESLRSIFIADKGMKMAKFDAKSGESFCVGAVEWNLFGDPKYLDVCESGDPHTSVARICWPHLAWPGTHEGDVAIAKEPYFRHLSRRDMCKKLGHGGNYGGRAETLSEETYIPVTVVDEFLRDYFRAFPSHQRWQRWVKDTVQERGYLITLTGRKRHFFGRLGDDKTIREAIAYDPQGSLADIVNRAMLNIWHHRDATLYMHDHDALTVQYPEEREDEVIPRVMKQLRYPLGLENGRTLCIPYDCKTGWNKGEWSEENPDGLKTYLPGDQRRRQKEVSILARKLR